MRRISYVFLVRVALHDGQQMIVVLFAGHLLRDVWSVACAPAAPPALHARMRLVVGEP